MPRRSRGLLLTVAVAAWTVPAYAQQPAVPVPTVPQTQTPLPTTLPILPPVSPNALPTNLAPSQAESVFSNPDDTKGATLGPLDAPFAPPRPSPPVIRPLSSDRDLIIEHLDTLINEPNSGIVIAVGNVQLLARGYRINCDRATFDRKRHRATFENNVVVQTGRQTVYADFLAFNTRTREFETRQGRTVLPPDQVSSVLLQPLRLSGNSVDRLGANTVATNGFLTTCDWDLPHYRIGFRKATVIPNKRVALRDAKLYFGDRVVLRLPYLSIPIRDDLPRTSYLPVVGRTQEEGYFVKTALGYAFSDLFPGIFRLDLIQKKGTGLGLDQAYQLGKFAVGTFVLYNLKDKSRGVTDTHGNLNHQQRIGDILATVTSNFQNNSYESVSSNSKTQQSTINLSRTQRYATTDSRGNAVRQPDLRIGGTTVSLNLQNSDYGFSSSNNNAYTITQGINIGNGVNNGTINLRLNGSASNNTSNYTATPTRSGRTEQNGDLTANGHFGIFEVELNANRALAARSTGTGGGGNFFAGTEKLPELLLHTETSRLGGLLNLLPGRLTFGYAKFVENPNHINTERGLFNYDSSLPQIPLTRGGGLSLNLQGGFRQSIYKGGQEEQYVLSNRSELIQQIGGGSNINLNYSYNRPYGGTPLNFQNDQTGSFNNAGAALNVNGYRVRLNLLTGFDIQRARDNTLGDFPKNPWQNLSIGLGFRPSDVFQTRFTGSYDINSHRLIDSTNRLRIRTNSGFALDTSLRYDPTTRKFPQITETLQTPLPVNGFRIVALAGYNGITSKFDYKNFALTRSYHDYEVSLTFIDQPYGFRTQSGFNFSFRLKAFPVTQSSNTGQFGTALDTGTGEVF